MKNRKMKNRKMKTRKMKTRKMKTGKGGCGCKTKKLFFGGKWSLQYKKSINCKKPKGFSQKQHCKYGKRR